MAPHGGARDHVAAPPALATENRLQETLAAAAVWAVVLASLIMLAFVG